MKAFRHIAGSSVANWRCGTARLALILGVISAVCCLGYQAWIHYLGAMRGTGAEVEVSPGQAIISEKESAPKMNIDIQWGGYYAVREEGEGQFGVFRLLDFNRSAYHAALFEEKFASIPSLEEVLRLSPYVRHAPIDSRALLRPTELHLLGGPQLAADDLNGYRVYLEHHEMEEKDIEALFVNVIGFSRQAPMKLALEVKGGALEVTERQ